MVDNNHNGDGRFSQDAEVRRKSILERFNAIDPKNRGVIVVDACSLFSLMGKAEQGKHYFDTLTFLSEHGYKIVIPDMVAYEVAQVLPNGKFLGRYFKGGLRDHHGLVHFVQDIAMGRHPNMSIARTEEPAHVGNFIKELVEITNRHAPGQSARQLIINHQDKYRNRKNWGDEAIREFLKKSPSSPPLHVLTEDYRFLNDIGPSMPDLNVLTVSGLLLGLAESGLSKAIPFLDHSANANELLLSCQQSIVEQGHEHKKISSTPFDVSMKVVFARPQVPHDFPMLISFMHTALGLGLGRPDQTRSIIGADISTIDEEESQHVKQLRRRNREARRHLKGGLNDTAGEWIKR